MPDWLKRGKAPEPRKGMPSPQLDEDEFRRRFRTQFQDPAFDTLQAELTKIVSAAWDGYEHSRKSPRTQKAGPEFSDPDYDLAVDWIAAKAAIQFAQRRHDDTGLPPRILLINCSSRSEHTCPGETRRERTRNASRRSNSKAGTTRNIWKGGFSRSSCTVMWKGPRTCAARSPTGCAS